MSSSYSFLRKVPFFADLPDKDLEQLCQMVEEVHLSAGELLFTEGSMGDRAYVIKEGQIEIYKNSGGRNVQLAVRQAGEVIGEISLLESSPRSASGRALTDSLLLAISQEQFDRMLDASPKAARTMLHTVSARLRSTEILLSQSDKMAQLGTLTAGIAHELNNPAAAARRGAEQLSLTLAHLQQVENQIHRLHLNSDQLTALSALGEEIRQAVSRSSNLDSLARNDLESELEDWLEEEGVENSWELAPALAGLGYDSTHLGQLLSSYATESIPVIIQWITDTSSAANLLDEIGQGTARISEIVKALKSYVYLDQAPVQEVDIHAGLENTLVVLRHKLKQGIEVSRKFDPNLPRIQAYASELNQVWTNIIDNAIDAMNGKGELTIRTQYKDPWVVVDIADNGTGIPKEVQEKLFNPFFTTKPMGKGTGLGLNISYNIIHKHGGDIKVISRPGETHFEIWLPLNFEALRRDGKSLAPIHREDDGALQNILEKTKTIAVVGMSKKQDLPAHSVPAYLQANGYRIIPVNPNLDEVLGEKAYPDLLSVPVPVDTVLVFRPSEFVMPVVDQAIEIGAKVVWMQEGIINEAAAQKASQAGIEVVMDTCMRQTHKRLNQLKVKG
jgi:signal transduction histidine kinase/predicted CoA-binding protein